MAAIAMRLESILIELFRGPVLLFALIIHLARMVYVWNAHTIAKPAKSIGFIARICSAKYAR